MPKKFNYRLPVVLVVFIVALLIAIGAIDRDKETLETIWLPSPNIQMQIDFSSLLRTMPGSVTKKGIEIFSENNWKVYRSYPSGHLDVFLIEDSGKEIRLDLTPGWRRDTHPMLIMSVPDRLIVVGYDVVRNVPSGRSLAVTQPGFDLFEITPATYGEPHVIARGLDLDGGIDSIVHGRILKSRITICAEIKCVDIGLGGEIKTWPFGNLREYEFIEVAFGRNSAYALSRKKWDDRFDGALREEHAEFFLVTLSPDNTSIEKIHGDGIPFALDASTDRPTWKTAYSPEELRDLFIYELSRMRNGGLINFGENNLEGRVAWSQVYYLNGLISIATGDLAFSDTELEKYARDRVEAEVNLIAGLAGTDYPGYRVKRYSIDREPLLFALHLGRIASLLARAENNSIRPPLAHVALGKLKTELQSFGHTVEEPIDCQLPDSQNCLTLAYRQGYPFWADGVNVPFNYVSGYVGGLLSVTSDELSLRFAQGLMEPLRVQEKFHELPASWRYWWSDGQNGWAYQNGNSLNTPEWRGNASGMDIAHITYRSMDAMALIMLQDKLNDASISAEVAHIRRLVSKGLLLPAVNEAFTGTDSRAALDRLVAKRYSRSSQAWHIQSQVWALSDLAAGFKGKLQQ